MDDQSLRAVKSIDKYSFHASCADANTELVARSCPSSAALFRMFAALNIHWFLFTMSFVSADKVSNF